MLIESLPKQCKACNKSIKGRTDKKFCDDYCRNTFHNHMKAECNNRVRNINNALRKNRRILQDLLPEKEKVIKTTAEKLFIQGFQFKYKTHSYTNSKGDVYFFCYEYGYLLLENNRYLIVKRNEE